MPQRTFDGSRKVSLRKTKWLKHGVAQTTSSANLSQLKKKRLLKVTTSRIRWCAKKGKELPLKQRGEGRFWAGTAGVTGGLSNSGMVMKMTIKLVGAQFLHLEISGTRGGRFGKNAPKQDANERGGGNCRNGSSFQERKQGANVEGKC